MDLFEHAARTQIPEEIPSDVALLFEKLALQVAATGRERYSADAILHRIRWFHQIERGEGDFKCNDHWTAPLSRWFLARHPDLERKKFFETRMRKSEAASA